MRVHGYSRALVGVGAPPGVAAHKAGELTAKLAGTAGHGGGPVPGALEGHTC